MLSTVFLELTNKCNMNCDFCANHLMKRPKGLMSLELAKSIIDQLKKIKYKGTLITSLMGEPLLHPHFQEILEYAIDSGIKTNVITNFLMVPERISIKKLLNAGIGVLCLSYQTPDKDTFKARRINQSFNLYLDKLTKILHFARNNSINTTRIEIHILQSLYNYLNVEIVNNYSLVESAVLRLNEILCKNKPKASNQYFTDKDIIKAVKNFKRGKQYLDAFEINLGSKIYIVLKRANTWANCLIPYGCEVQPQKKGHCDFYSSSLGVLWDGRCTVCCQDFDGSIFIGDAKSETLKEILYGQILNSLQKRERKGELVNRYCQTCKGIIKKDKREISIIKNQGIINKSFNLAHRITTKLAQ